MEENNQEVKSSVKIRINRQLHDEAKVERKVSKEQKIKEVRQELTSIVNIAHQRPDQITFQGYFGAERMLNREIFNRAKTFFLPPDAEMNHMLFMHHLHDKDFGLKSENGHPRFLGRYMFPIMDFNGEVIGLIGYDKHSDVKYLLSTNVGFGKVNTFYGMWMMPWIYSMGYIVVVEGIVDCLWLWSLGIPAIALNGNTMTSFVARILRRFGYHVILAPDNDETGEVAIRYWKKELPKASVLKIDLGNDIDKWRKLHQENRPTGEQECIQLINEIIGKFNAYADSRTNATFKVEGMSYAII